MCSRHRSTSSVQLIVGPAICALRSSVLYFAEMAPLLLPLCNSRYYSEKYLFNQRLASLRHILHLLSNQIRLVCVQLECFPFAVVTLDAGCAGCFTDGFFSFTWIFYDVDLHSINEYDMILECCLSKLVHNSLS